MALPPDPHPLDETFSPPMGVILAAVAISFLIMGFFTVYFRTRLGDAHRGGGDRAYISSSDWGRRSCRRPAGLDTEVIDKFPVIEYSAVKGVKIGKGALECAVCLSEFADDETLRLIPKCDHAFHLVCIDTWLVSNPTCPVCRACLVPDPYDELAGRVSMPIPGSEATSSEAVIMIELDTQRGGGGEGEAPEASGSAVNGCTTTSSTGAIADEKRRPGRSSSMKARIARMFTRSHTTGHSLPPAGEDRERFTLRLPEGVREQITMNSNTLNRTKSCVVVGLADGKSSEWEFEPYSERVEAAGHQKCRMLPTFMTAAGTRSAKVADDEVPGRGHACCDLADMENACEEA